MLAATTTVLVLSLLFTSPILPVGAKAKSPAVGSSQFRLKHIFAHGVNPPLHGVADANLNEPTSLFMLHHPVSDDSVTNLAGTYTLKHTRQELVEWSTLREDGGQEGQAGRLKTLTKKWTEVPDATDPETVLHLAQMTRNAYLEPDDKAWITVPGWNATAGFGWAGTGLRGYVFLNPEDDIAVMVVKGTTLATPVGGGPSAPADKYNDNIMFSCCCAKAGWSWTPHSSFANSYYNLAQTMYSTLVEYLKPHTTIWLAGHSLGGALASLVALTNDLPAFTYQAPGDLQYAFRLGLLPSLPPPPDSDPGTKPKDPNRPDYTEFLRTLPIYHFGNDGDPIFLGECVGPASSCWWFDYAMETGCHTGHQCVYNISSVSGGGLNVAADPEFPPGPSHGRLTDQRDRQQSWSIEPMQQKSVRFHTIDWVLTNLLNPLPPVPECKVIEDCLKRECSAWDFV
ncbi:putative lipase atg15 [Gaertneriomyces sp. JEL0708]|nr:putative lipase atg15 [Gaertneriomyces sp. JEL0708]